MELLQMTNRLSCLLECVPREGTNAIWVNAALWGILSLTEFSRRLLRSFRQHPL